jgi:hypothetical protein
MTDSISIRRVVRRTIAIYVAQARVLLSLAAVAVVVLTVLDAGLARSVPVLGIFVFIASIAVFALFTGMVVMLAANIWEERPAMTVRELVVAVRPMLGELILVGFEALIAISFCYSFASTLLLVLALGVIIAGAGAHVGGFVVIAGLGVIVLLVPGTYLLTVWSVALPVVVLERPGGLRALRRSRELVRGNRWRVLGLALLFAVTVGVGIRVLDLAAGSAGQDPGIAVVMLAAILLTPIPVLGATALYFELRQMPATDLPATGTPPHPPSPLPTPPGAITAEPGSLRP